MQCPRNSCTKPVSATSPIEYSGPLCEYGMKHRYCSSNCLLDDMAEAITRRTDAQARADELRHEVEGLDAVE